MLLLIKLDCIFVDHKSSSQQPSIKSEPVADKENIDILATDFDEDME